MKTLKFLLIIIGVLGVIASLYNMSVDGLAGNHILTGVSSFCLLTLGCKMHFQKKKVEL